MKMLDVESLFNRTVGPLNLSKSVMLFGKCLVTYFFYQDGAFDALRLFNYIFCLEGAVSRLR